MFLEWDGKTIGPWAYALEGAELVINLAGRSVNCRYDARNREEILRSRIDSTRMVGKAIAACRVAPKLWINSSTATYYRHAEDEPQDEWHGSAGEGFSCDVARAWEDAFFSEKPENFGDQSGVAATKSTCQTRLREVLAWKPRAEEVCSGG